MALSLAQLLEVATLSLAHKRDLLRQMAAGLVQLHCLAVAHNDLKPDNMLLDEEGTLKLADLGQASFKALHLALPRGTPGYLAPEVEALTRGEGRPFDPFRSDVFVLGLVFFELLFGRLPFPRAHLSDPGYALFFYDPQSFYR